MCTLDEDPSFFIVTRPTFYCNYFPCIIIAANWTRYSQTQKMRRMPHRIIRMTSKTPPPALLPNARETQPVPLVQLVLLEMEMVAVEVVQVKAMLNLPLEPLHILLNLTPLTLSLLTSIPVPPWPKWRQRKMKQAGELGNEKGCLTRWRKASLIHYWLVR